MADFNVIFDDSPSFGVDFSDLSVKTDIKLQSKSEKITANGNYNYTPDKGYDGIGAVAIDVDVRHELPTVDNPATAADILSGKQALDGDGNVLTGSFVDMFQYLEAVRISKDISLTKIPDLYLPKCISFSAANVQAYFGTLEFSLPVECQYGFTGCINVEELTFVGGIKATGSWRDAFRGCGNLTKINGDIDMTNCSNYGNLFYLDVSLEEIRFVANSIKLSISFQHSIKLSDESVQSIIDGLYDYGTSSTTHTLTLHSDVKNRLTEAQKADITNKNWTLA